MISVQYSFVEYCCTTPRQCTVDARGVQDKLQEGCGQGRTVGIKAAFETFHGLRKNATGALMEASCTEEQARSITGNKTTQMINKYSIGVRQERIARQVQNIWETQKQ